jgi:hypothetical protein
LLTECNFTEALWNLTVTYYSLPAYLVMSAQGGLIDWTNSLPAYLVLSAQGGLIDWTNHLLISGNIMDKRRKIGVLFSC